MKIIAFRTLLVLAFATSCFAEDFKIGENYRIVGKFKKVDEEGKLLIELKGNDVKPFTLPSKLGTEQFDIKSLKEGMLIDVNFLQKANEQLIQDINKSVPPPRPIPSWPGTPPPTTNVSKSLPRVLPVPK